MPNINFNVSANGSTFVDGVSVESFVATASGTITVTPQNGMARSFTVFANQTTAINVGLGDSYYGSVTSSNGATGYVIVGQNARAAAGIAGVLPYALGTTGAGAYSPYLGQVGTRCAIPDTLNNGATDLMSRRAEFARENLTSLVLCYGNFYTTLSGESAPGATRLVRASIEYPAGTYTQVIWGGSAQITLTDGQAISLSDPIAVNIPRGAQYWVKTYSTSSAGVMFKTQYRGWTAGDSNTTVTGTPDATMTSYTGTAGGAVYGPYAILANTINPTIAILGDSRPDGLGTTNNSVAYPGTIAPSLAPFVGTLNLAQASQQANQLANQFNAAFAKRAQYLPYVSHAILELGINDINTAGRTAAQVQADRQTIRGYQPSLHWFETTLEPITTSTDSWATLTNQTTIANNAVRVAFNNQVRGGNIGFEGFLELADGSESGRDTGILKAPPMTPTAITADGVHTNNSALGFYRPQVPVGLFRR